MTRLIKCRFDCVDCSLRIGTSTSRIWLRGGKKYVIHRDEVPIRVAELAQARCGQSRVGIGFKGRVQGCAVNGVPSKLRLIIPVERVSRVIRVAVLKVSFYATDKVVIVGQRIKDSVATLNESRANAGSSRAADGSQINAERIIHVVGRHENTRIKQTDNRRWRQCSLALVVGIKELTKKCGLFAVQIILAGGKRLPAILR